VQLPDSELADAREFLDAPPDDSGNAN